MTGRFFHTTEGREADMPKAGRQGPQGLATIGNVPRAARLPNCLTPAAPQPAPSGAAGAGTGRGESVVTPCWPAS